MAQECFAHNREWREQLWGEMFGYLFGILPPNPRVWFVAAMADLFFVLCMRQLAEHCAEDVLPCAQLSIKDRCVNMKSCLAGFSLQPLSFFPLHGPFDFGIFSVCLGPFCGPPGLCGSLYNTFNNDDT